MPRLSFSSPLLSFGIFGAGAAGASSSAGNERGSSCLPEAGEANGARGSGGGGRSSAVGGGSVSERWEHDSSAGVEVWPHASQLSCVRSSKPNARATGDAVGGFPAAAAAAFPLPPPRRRSVAFASWSNPSKSSHSSSCASCC